MHDAFLRTILESPDDPDPRLVFADWLEEQPSAADQARGRLVRAQCRLAGLADLSPERLDLEEECRALLGRYQDAWERPIREALPADHEHGIIFEFLGGFVEFASLHAHLFLLHGETLFGLTPLRSARLLEVSDHLPPLAASPLLGRLTSLTLASRDYLRDAGLAQVVSSPHLAGLHSLDVSANRVGPSGVTAIIASLPGVATLNLSANPLGDAGLGALSAAGPGGLAELNLAGTQCGDRRALEALLRRLPGLRRLDLGYNPLTTDSLQGVADSPGAARLESLALAGCRLRAAGAQALAGSPYLSRLARLDLAENALGDAGVTALARSSRLGRLRSLDLRRNGVGPAGAAALGESASLRRLVALDLSGNELGTDGVTALLAGDWPDLALLDLRSNRLGDRGLRALAESSAAGRLRALALPGNAIGDAGVAALAGRGGLDELRVLNLRANRLTNAAAASLADAPFVGRLHRLDVSGNAIADGPLRRLRERLGRRLVA